ncbi:MAG: hypothetical protein MJE68_27640, partial [Proteobacteria bacterium]|nr:hypothetical protein [Pseudomonadota bacterium]
ITIGFLETSYTVSEGDRNVPLMIGVIGHGGLEIDIVVTVSTSDHTAICKLILIANKPECCMSIKFYCHCHCHCSIISYSSY